MKRKKMLIAVIIVLIITILIFPIKTRYKEGGTITYTSLLYKVIIWHAIEKVDVKEGTDVYFFPNNFHDYQYYYERSR